MFEHFISSIEMVLLTMVDNLVTYIYIENENFEDFTIEDGEWWILLYKTFNFKDFTMKDTKFCVCV